MQPDMAVVTKVSNVPDDEKCLALYGKRIAAEDIAGPSQMPPAEDIAGPSQMPPKKPRKNSKNQKTVEVSDNSTPPDSEAETPEVARPSDVESSVGDSDFMQFRPTCFCIVTSYKT